MLREIFRNWSETLCVSAVKSPMADLTWNKGGKRLLAGIDRLIELLHAFDENPLPDKALESVTQLLSSHAFTPEYQAKDHAISCVPILSLWVVGVVKWVLLFDPESYTCTMKVLFLILNALPWWIDDLLQCFTPLVLWRSQEEIKSFEMCSRYHVHLLNKVQPAIVRVDKATQALDIARQKFAVMESKINVRIYFDCWGHFRLLGSTKWLRLSFLIAEGFRMIQLQVPKSLYWKSQLLVCWPHLYPSHQKRAGSTRETGRTTRFVRAGDNRQGSSEQSDNPNERGTGCCCLFYWRSQEHGENLEQRTRWNPPPQRVR